MSVEGGFFFKINKRDYTFIKEMRVSSHVRKVMDMLDFVLFLFVFMISEKISGLHFDGSYAGQQIKGPRVARNCQKVVLDTLLL